MPVLYTASMSKKISGGTAHELPTDLRKALAADAKALAKWEDLTPLSRNEWICWTTYVKRTFAKCGRFRKVALELQADRPSGNECRSRDDRLLPPPTMRRDGRAV